jgi:hypothetical protein
MLMLILDCICLSVYTSYATATETLHAAPALRHRAEADCKDLAVAPSGSFAASTPHSTEHRPQGAPASLIAALSIAQLAA